MCVCVRVSVCARVYVREKEGGGNELTKSPIRRLPRRASPERLLQKGPPKKHFHEDISRRASGRAPCRGTPPEMPLRKGPPKSFPQEPLLGSLSTEAFPEGRIQKGRCTNKKTQKGLFGKRSLHKGPSKKAIVQ